MCLVSDVVPPLAGILLFAVLGVLHHFLSVSSVCIFKTAHCPLSYLMLQAANSPEKRPFLARFGIRRSFAKKGPVDLK